MRDFILKLLSENNSSMQISLYSWWHIFYLIIIFGTALLIGLLLRKKSDRAKDITLSVFAYLTIGLYVADFFLMPLSDSYSGISVYKLPFNICTLMAVFVPFAQFNKKFKPVKSAIVTLSVASSLMWMVYPGSALGGQPPFSYIIFQTFMYHGFLFIWGFLNYVFYPSNFNIKHIWKEFVGIIIILNWASFGNELYPNQNWFFIQKSIFPFLPDKIMPLMVVISVFGVCLCIYGIFYAVKGISKLILKSF